MSPRVSVLYSKLRRILAQQIKWAFQIPDGFVISKVLRVCGMEDNESQLYLVS